jgi:hypothetical protein
VLAAVKLDYQAPLAADKVRVVAIDGLLAEKFEAAELPSAMCVHKSLSSGRAKRGRVGEFCRCERPPQ